MTVRLKEISKTCYNSLINREKIDHNLIFFNNDSPQNPSYDDKDGVCFLLNAEYNFFSI